MIAPLSGRAVSVAAAGRWAPQRTWRSVAAMAGGEGTDAASTGLGESLHTEFRVPGDSATLHLPDGLDPQLLPAERPPHPPGGDPRHARPDRARGVRRGRAHRAP